MSMDLTDGSLLIAGVLLAKNGGDVTAIRLANEATGCGLRAAKDWFERVVTPLAFPKPATVESAT